MINDQARHLRQSLAIKANEKKGHTIAIVSGKGGVGKSNIAVNFSLALLNQQKSVLLIDLDVGMGNIEILLGLTAKYTIVDMIKQRMQIEAIIEQGPDNISYIAGGNSLEHMFTLTKDDANHFFQQYEKAQQLYDYIIFDIGAGVNSDSMFFVLAADECFVVTTPEPTAITDAYGMIKHIVKLDATKPLYLIMNRTRSTSQGKQAMTRFQKVVKSFLNTNIYALGLLPDDQRVTQAVIKQKPLLITNERAPMANGIKQMTHNYLVDTPADNQRLKPSFIQKFKRFLMKR